MYIEWIMCDAWRDLVPFVQFKKREKHPWRSVNFSVACNFTKINTPPWVFFKFFKLYKWHQIEQRTTSVGTEGSLLLSTRLDCAFCYFKKCLGLNNLVNDCRWEEDLDLKEGSLTAVHQYFFSFLISLIYFGFIKGNWYLFSLIRVF